MKWPLHLLLLGSLAAAAIGVAAAQEPAKESAASAPQASSPSAPPSAPSGPATYVGSEMCQACHEDTFKNFTKNPHHVLESDTKRGPGGKGPENKGWKGKTCEACHGPGSRHVESLDKKDIRNPATLPPGESNKLCLTCHLNQPAHSAWNQNAHAKNQVACVGCHTLHGTAAQLRPVTAAAKNAMCSSCHVSVWASFQQPFKHKVPEGAMSCVDCHNPHGRSLSSTNRPTAVGNEPGCLNCHGDKRGPFVYEHEPVRTEGCMACHVPHGSANPRMLTRSEPRTTCLECHANVGVAKSVLGSTPPAFHDLRNPRYRSCADCHVKVHGSNVSPALLR